VGPGEVPTPRARSARAQVLFVALSLGSLAAVVAVTEVAAYRWRASVDHSHCYLGCAPIHYEELTWLIRTHMASTTTYDVVVMVARQCVVIALAVVAAVVIVPTLAGHMIRRDQTAGTTFASPRRRVAMVAAVAAGLLLVGLSAGVASAVLQHPFPVTVSLARS
jgi:hypothetical protein